MAQTQAVWLLIGLALLSAGLPFWLQRPLVCMPWSHAIAPGRPAWQRVLVSVLHWAVLALWAWMAMAWIGHSLAASSLALAARILLLLLILAGLLLWPGYQWQWRAHPAKSFVSRLLETVVLYFLVGVLGVAFETQLGNPFPQGWEFYAITLCLYLVLAFPGFVYRYLLRHRARA